MTPGCRPRRGAARCHRRRLGAGGSKRAGTFDDGRPGGPSCAPTALRKVRPRLSRRSVIGRSLRRLPTIRTRYDLAGARRGRCRQLEWTFRQCTLKHDRDKQGRRRRSATVRSNVMVWQGIRPTAGHRVVVNSRLVPIIRSTSTKIGGLLKAMENRLGPSARTICSSVSDSD